MEELKTITTKMKETFDGDPWFGKSISKILNEVTDTKVYVKPGKDAHSLIELLYHMLTWENFALHQLTDHDQIQPDALELLDWRKTNPELHTWNTGVAEFTAAHHKILQYVESCGDEVLTRKVKYRDYDMRYLLNGLIDHNIYHTGQIAWLSKYLNS